MRVSSREGVRHLMLTWWLLTHHAVAFCCSVWMCVHRMAFLCLQCIQGAWCLFCRQAQPTHPATWPISRSHPKTRSSSSSRKCETTSAQTLTVSRSDIVLDLYGRCGTDGITGFPAGCHPTRRLSFLLLSAVSMSGIGIAVHPPIRQLRVGLSGRCVFVYIYGGLLLLRHWAQLGGKHCVRTNRWDRKAMCCHRISVL